AGSGSVGGIVERYDLRTGQARNVEVWPESTGGWPAADLKYRFVWTFPLTISPHDPGKIYVGSQYVHQTTDAGASWQVISPDLTLNDKSRQQISGGLTPDNIGVEYAGAVFAIAESPLKAGLISAGPHHRRARPCHGGRRQKLDERHTQHPGTAGVGDGEPHRALPLRGEFRLPRRRPAPGEQSGSLCLQDHGPGQDLEEDHRGPAPESPLLRSRAAGGSGAAWAALPGPREWPPGLLRRRWQVAALAEQPPGRPGLRPRGAA